MTDSELLDIALRMPMSSWERIADHWIDKGPGFDYFPTADSRGSMGEATRSIDYMIQALVRFNAYIEMRHGNGCGDQGHKSAVKEQNKVAKKVRKALGFSHPQQDIDF